MGLESEQTGVLQPHPRPQTYKQFLYAIAEWIEDREFEKLKAVIESNGASLKNL